MILEMFAVYDRKTGAFSQPFFLRSKPEAMRSFIDAIASKDHVFARHPDDYTVHHIGAWDDTTGLVQQGDPKLVLLSGVEAVAAAKG